MPAWILKSYQISHFLAMLPPALYPFIFSGSDFLAMFPNATTDREVLIENENKEEDCEMTTVSLDEI